MATAGKRHSETRFVTIAASKALRGPDIPYMYLLGSPCGVSLPERIDYLQILHQWTINRADELLCRWRIYNSQRRNLHFRLESFRGNNFTLKLASPDGVLLSEYDTETNLNVVYGTSDNETVLDMLSTCTRDTTKTFQSYPTMLSQLDRIIESMDRKSKRFECTLTEKFNFCVIENLSSYSVKFEDGIRTYVTDQTKQDGQFGSEHLSTNDDETVSINITNEDDTETSRIGSCLTITCSYASEQSLATCSHIFHSSSKEPEETNQDTRLYSRFGNLFAELIEGLKSCRWSTVGRSKSDRSTSKRRKWNAEKVASTSGVIGAATSTYTLLKRSAKCAYRVLQNAQSECADELGVRTIQAGFMVISPYVAPKRNIIRSPWSHYAHFHSFAKIKHGRNLASRVRKIFTDTVLAGDLKYTLRNLIEKGYPDPSTMAFEVFWASDAQANLLNKPCPPHHIKDGIITSYDNWIFPMSKRQRYIPEGISLLRKCPCFLCEGEKLSRTIVVFGIHSLSDVTVGHLVVKRDGEWMFVLSVNWMVRTNATCLVPQLTPRARHTTIPLPTWSTEPDQVNPIYAEKMKAYFVLIVGRQQRRQSISTVFRSVDDMRINMDPVTMELVKHGPAYPMGVFPSTHLDLSIVNPTVKVHEFRCRFPSSFLALITNYLGYLIFSPEDTKEIQNALIKEAKASRDNSREHSYARSFSGCSSPAQRRRRSSRTGRVDKELEHWYTVVHTLLLYLLENKRYKQRFILRRPGNQSNMNELERKLFPPRLNIWICSKDQTDELVRRPAMVPEILSILRDYDTSVLASVLARVLRPHGVGLIPCYLRSLFLQLVSNTMESEIHQRRAIRLLFQLVPTRLLRMVIRPVFELLAGIANEPTCEVDEYSLAVLFSPILFLDQSTTTPASLANPLPARAVELLVRTALRDLQSHQSLDRTFRVPVLFQKDCMRNLTQHM
ncbi:hypothetical protein CLF_110961, partial [Clonorchis sinensis]